MGSRGAMRTALLALLACALLAWAPAGAGAAVFKGRTAQKFKISIAPAGRHRIKLLRFKIRLRCRDGSLLYDDLSDFEPARVRGDGRFGDFQKGPSDEVIFRGRVGKGKITGRLRVRDKLKNGVPCDSGTVGFATRQVRRGRR
jgi:hypothetical protein